MSFSKFVLPSLYFQNLRRCETFEHFFVIFEKNGKQHFGIPILEVLVFNCFNWDFTKHVCT